MKNLILFSLILFIASCKKNKIKIEEISLIEKKVLKKLRVEINMIKGDYKNFHIHIDIGSLTLKDGVSFGEPLIIKPANLDFTEKYKSANIYALDVEKGKVKKNYIIESKEPVQEGIIAFCLVSCNEEEKEPPIIEIKVFADGKQIEVFNYTGIMPHFETIEMKKYF